MLDVKKTLAKLLDAFPRVEVKNSWTCLILNGYILCSQQFTLTPTAASTTVNRTLTLPYEMADTSYHIQMTPNSRVETNVFNYGAQRNSTTSIIIHMFASNTTTRYFFVTVLGRLA